ncbi:MAG: c-type cytochrome, partial [Sphingopyxis sp.]
VFQKCAACHTATAGGAAGIGPNLHGVVGRGIAAGSFAFSDALKSHGGTWDWASLNAWLTSPRRFADGTKMSFAGLSSAEDRANLMAWLNTQGSNLPMPAAPAPVAETEADAAAPAAAH